MAHHLVTVIFSFRVWQVIKEFSRFSEEALFLFLDCKVQAQGRPWSSVAILLPWEKQLNADRNTELKELRETKQQHWNKPCLKLNLSCKYIPLYFWDQCTLFATQVNLTDISSQCCSQVTHLKQNEGLKIQACGELHQTYVYKQKAEMAESKSNNNTKIKTIKQGKEVYYEICKYN